MASNINKAKKIQKPLLQVLDVAHHDLALNSYWKNKELHQLSFSTKLVEQTEVEALGKLLVFSSKISSDWKVTPPDTLSPLRIEGVSDNSMKITGVSWVSYSVY